MALFTSPRRAWFGILFESLIESQKATARALFCHSRKIRKQPSLSSYTLRSSVCLSHHLHVQRQIKCIPLGLCIVNSLLARRRRHGLIFVAVAATRIMKKCQQASQKHPRRTSDTEQENPSVNCTRIEYSLQEVESSPSYSRINIIPTRETREGCEYILLLFLVIASISQFN